MLNALLCANMLIVPRCICFCPAALRQRQRKSFQLPGVSGQSSFKMLQKPSCIPSRELYPSPSFHQTQLLLLFFCHPEIDSHSHSRICNLPVTRACEITHKCCKGYIKPKPGRDAILTSPTAKRSVQLIPSGLP